jgi:(2Fe-2S) ferredoxin
VTSERACGTRPPGAVPGLTACSLCAGETLGSGDALDGGQLARLRALAARGTAQLTLAECLDECERGDVVVARPSGDARRTAGGRPVWFERVAGDELTGALAGWLDAGGPGVDPVPDALAAYVIERGGEPGAEG